MSNPYFVAIHSTDEVYVGQEVTKCLTEELQGIKDDHALVNHNHDGVYSPVNHNHDNAYAPSVAAITAHMEAETYSAPVGSAYTSMPLSNNVVVGTGLTMESNGIRIGAGITKVRVSGQLCVGSSQRTGTKNVAIHKNGNVQIVRAQVKLSEDTTAVTMSIAPLVTNVAEGDLLSLDFYGLKDDTIYGGLNLTYITVEKLA